MNLNILSIILAGVFQGFANTIRKHSSTIQHRATTMTTTAMLVNSIMSVPLLFYQFRLPATMFTWLLVALSVCMYSFSFTYMFKSLQNMDLSLSTILQRLNVLFVVCMGALVLKEQLSPVGYIGIVS